MVDIRRLRIAGFTKAEAPGALGRELLGIAALGAGLLIAAAAGLSASVRMPVALGWLLAALVCWGVVVCQCRQRLHLNRSTLDGTDFPTLGHGNRITLLRGLLIAATAGFIAAAPNGLDPWLLYLPAVLYSLAALGDWLDGFVARRQQQTTELGTQLDTVLDALGLLIAPLLAVLLGKLHISYLLVSVAYYLFQGGIRWRQRRSLPVYPLPPSPLRRHLAGIQMALVAIALWPPLPAEMTRTAGVILMIPLLLGFCRDWLYVSGRLGPDQGQAS